MTSQKRIGSEAEAIERALRLTGFDALPRVAASAERETVTSDETPFLAGQIIGRQAFRVELSNVRLSLPSAIPGYRDPYVRRFFVLLDEETGQLLGITSVFDGVDPDMRPPPTAAQAEAQLGPAQDNYWAFPPDDPGLTLLRALDAILSRGIGSPFVAKEIHAVYALQSGIGAKPRAVWAVTLRGLPPFPVFGLYGDDVPVWQRNHMRNVVDATTGEVLFATNSPQPI